MSYGIKVSKTGEDVSSGNAEDFALSSDYSSKSIALEGTISLTTNTSETWEEVTVTHNFGYIPQVDAFVVLSHGGTASLPGIYMFETDGASDCALDCSGVPHDVEQFRVKLTTTTIVFGARNYCTCIIPGFGSTETYHEHEYTITYKTYMERVNLP